MFFKKKTVVYLSYDEADFEKAKSLLIDAKIKFYEYQAEEMPVVCCGAGLDPRKLNSDGKQRLVYRISVATEDEQKALGLLKGQVLEIRTVHGF